MTRYTDHDAEDSSDEQTEGLCHEYHQDADAEEDGEADPLHGLRTHKVHDDGEHSAAYYLHHHDNIINKS